MLPKLALASWSHACCRCAANWLMLGPACASGKPASKADVLTALLVEPNDRAAASIRHVCHDFC